MSIIRTSDAAKEPVGLTDMKAYLRIDCDSEDAFIRGLIKAARNKCENFTERSFITQTWVQTLDCIPMDSKKAPWWDGEKQGAISSMIPLKNCIELPRGPLQSVTHLKTFNESDTEATFDSSNYYVDTQSMVGRLCLNSGSSWPTDLRAHNAIEIEYIAGYGDSAGFVPPEIKEAIKMLAAHMYENRGCDDARMPSGVSCLLEPYVVTRVV